jgi:hypothetical protein
MTRKKNTWSIGKRVAGLCAILVVVTIATGLVGVISVQKLLLNLTGVAKVSIPKIEQLTTLQALGLEFRGTSLLMGTPGLSQDYKSKQIVHLKELRTEINKNVETYGRSITPEETVPYQQLVAATNNFVKAIDRFQTLSLGGKAEEAGAFWSASGGAVSKSFRKAQDDEVLLNQRSTDRRVEAGMSAASWAHSPGACW